MPSTQNIQMHLMCQYLISIVSPERGSCPRKEGPRKEGDASDGKHLVTVVGGRGELVPSGLSLKMEKAPSFEPDAFY